MASDQEVAGLARLPHQPAAHRFDAATAPHLPAPPGIPLLPYPGDEGPEAYGDDLDHGGGAPTGEAA